MGDHRLYQLTLAAVNHRSALKTSIIEMARFNTVKHFKSIYRKQLFCADIQAYVLTLEGKLPAELPSCVDCPSNEGLQTYWGFKQYLCDDVC